MDCPSESQMEHITYNIFNLVRCVVYFCLQNCKIINFYYFKALCLWERIGLAKKFIWIFLLKFKPTQYYSMATHSRTLAWKIPWTEEPGRLQSMGSLSRTRLSDFTFTFHFHALEKEMATHSSVLAWRIPGIGEPGGLPSMGSHRVGYH